MNPRVPYGHRYKYPHMKPRDVAIWERFIEALPNAYEECIYDQPLGNGETVPEGTDPEIAKDWKVLTQWKVDVVGYYNGSVDVIEVKPDAGISAIGQVKSYAYLFDQLDGDAKPVRPVIVTDRERPDMRALCAEQGVTLIVV